MKSAKLAHYDAHGQDDKREFVTVTLAGQVFGIPVEDVREVFSPAAITRVPGSRPEVQGVLNLRGRIVTAVSMRARLGLQPLSDATAKPMAVGVEYREEAYAVMVDEVGEVMNLPASAYEANPPNIPLRWQSISRGVYRLDGTLLVEISVEQLLRFTMDDTPAAALV
jgi:purine-binding chemotaxis protein CheW